MFVMLFRVSSVMELAEASGQPIFLLSFTQSRVLELLHTFAYQGLGIFLAPYTITTAFYADN